MRHVRFIPLALLLCLAAPGAVSASGAGDYGISFLVPGASGYNHGPSYVTRLGSALLVGSPGEGTGAVDVYDLKSGARTLHLTPVASGYGVGFGVGVTASARGFLVGDLEANEAYEFKRRTGELLRTFRPPPDMLARWFGAAIADLGALIAIGDPAAVAEPFGAEPQGRVHLYDARDGALLQTLLDPVAKRQSTFGASVVRVAGGFAVGQPSGYYDPGSVYVYDRHGVLVQTLRAPAPARNDRFGAALAASGGRLLVGAPGGGIFEAPVDGRVYVFERRGRRFVPVVYPGSAGRVGGGIRRRGRDRRNASGRRIWERRRALRVRVRHAARRAHRSGRRLRPLQRHVLPALVRARRERRARRQDRRGGERRRRRELRRARRGLHPKRRATGRLRRPVSLSLGARAYASGRLEINRRNSRRSTGPRTIDGKARSRWNARTHGILSRETVISSGEAKEDANEFRRISERFWEDLCPVGVLEEVLVEEIVTSYWRLRRVRRAENGAIRAAAEASVSREEQDRLERERELLEDDDVPIVERGRDLLGVESQLAAIDEARSAFDDKGFLTLRRDRARASGYWLPRRTHREAATEAIRRQRRRPVVSNCVEAFDDLRARFEARRRELVARGKREREYRRQIAAVPSEGMMMR